MTILRILFILFIILSNCQCKRNKYFCGSYDSFISSKSEVVTFDSISHEDTILAIVRGQVMGKFITSKVKDIDTLHFATLEFRSQDLPFHALTTSDSKGFYEQFLSPGTYTISCGYSGMNTCVITNKTIKEGEVNELIFLLGTGNSKDTVDFKGISE